MIKSMTGYGKAQCDTPNKKITIEIKSLNSKQIDINTKIPYVYNEKDIEIRTLLSQKLQRGKVVISIIEEKTGKESNYSLNKELAKKYYSELKSLASEINEKTETDYLSMITHFPEVLQQEKEELDKNEWMQIQNCINEAIDELDKFRMVEGKSLEKDFIDRIVLIKKLLSEVDNYEGERIVNLKKRFRKNLTNFLEENKIDESRFEQEVLYYIEKIDVTEEKIRLSKHLDYFIETINESVSQGKKLNFISQEIGREINTLGSKANDVDIQKIVVQMKDELEKIKEQLMNIL